MNKSLTFPNKQSSHSQALISLFFSDCLKNSMAWTAHAKCVCLTHYLLVVRKRWKTKEILWFHWHGTKTAHCHQVAAGRGVQVVSRSQGMRNDPSNLRYRWGSKHPRMTSDQLKRSPSVLQEDVHALILGQDSVNQFWSMTRKEKGNINSPSLTLCLVFPPTAVTMNWRYLYPRIKPEDEARIVNREYQVHA